VASVERSWLRGRWRFRCLADLGKFGRFEAERLELLEDAEHRRPVFKQANLKQD